MTYRVIIFLFIFLIFSCDNLAERDDLEFYNLSSTELINQILIDNEIDCSCLLEPPHQSFLELMATERPNRNNRDDLIKALELSNDSIFTKLNFISQKFRIAELNINSKMKLLKRVEFDSIFLGKDVQKGREILWNKCPSGWLSITPPIFNRTYNIAIIGVSNCTVSGSMTIYKLINGKWTFEKNIYFWVN